MPPPERAPQVAIVVHDVAPATWRECETLLAMADALGAAPCTLLVVPDWHRTMPLRVAQPFAAALARRLARGDELCLHGYFHVDDAPPPNTLRGLVERRLFTRREGEFAAIGQNDATARLVHGIATFHALQWPLYGFVPPAWLLSEGARRALDASGHAFEYVPVRSGIHVLPSWRWVPTANLCYSPDRAWRRLGSRLLIRRELVRARDRRLLRISLHPQDVHVPEVVSHWKLLVEQVLRTHTPVTKRDGVRSLLPLAA